ncbi:hypothetical protein BG006_002187 [Podila minutissima]|uniref:Uncharacterized protein n=1 Tax=Podila minutissima TaxID=64525 RepID=A0A9P5VGD4_9FUNG|nr:hypothetical protein BG006_002187 [Podila minutissima]
MKITSIVLALGAVIASVHAALPASVGPIASGLTQGLNSPAAKRGLPLPGTAVTTNNEAANGAVKMVEDAVSQTAGKVTGLAAKRSLGLPGKDGLLPKTDLPFQVKRDDVANVDIAAAVHALVEVYLGPVNDAMAVLKAEIVAQVTVALQVEGNIKVTKAILKTIEATVDAAIKIAVDAHITAVVNAKIAAIVNAHVSVNAAVDANVVAAIVADLSVLIEAQVSAVITAVVKANIIATVLAAIKVNVLANVAAVLKVTLSVALDIAADASVEIGACLDAVVKILANVTVN